MTSSSSSSASESPRSSLSLGDNGCCNFVKSYVLPYPNQKTKFSSKKTSFQLTPKVFNSRHFMLRICFFFSTISINILLFWSLNSFKFQVFNFLGVPTGFSFQLAKALLLGQKARIVHIKALKGTAQQIVVERDAGRHHSSEKVLKMTRTVGSKSGCLLYCKVRMP